MRSMKSASVALKCIAMAASWMISGADSPMTWTPRTRSSIEDAMNFTKPVVLWTAPARGTYASGGVVATAGEGRARTWASGSPTPALGGGGGGGPGGGGGDLGAVLAADDVARRPDVRLARTQLGVDHDEPIVKRHAGSVEPERLGVRRPAPGPEQPLGPDDPAGARQLDRERDPALFTADALDPGPAEDVDALGDEDLAEGPPQAGFVAREEPRARDHRHPAAEPAEHLGELDRDVAAAEDDERRGQLGKPAGLVRIEQVAGQVRDRIEARDERDRRAAARGDEDAVAPDLPIAHRS